MEILNEKAKFETGKPVDEKKQKLIRRLTILVAIWGVLNLLFSSFIFGVIFILIAIVIHLSKRFMAIYAVGVVLFILALIQLLAGTGIVNIGFTEGMAQGTELIIIAIANFAIGAFIIYRTRKLEKV